MKEYDLAVIGGGFAGVAAAIAAAREGADVIIIEKSNALGGVHQAVVRNNGALLSEALHVRRLAREE